jgi:hypothetical protein
MFGGCPVGARFAIGERLVHDRCMFSAIYNFDADRPPIITISGQCVRYSIGIRSAAQCDLALNDASYKIT